MINWSISQLDCVPQEDGKLDVVVTAHWECVSAQDGASARMYGSVGFTLTDGSFTPYDQLTQEQVLDWCWLNGVDKNAIEAALNGEIQAKINPPIVNPPLPWQTLEAPI